jgi:hypothetical protein
MKTEFEFTFNKEGAEFNAFVVWCEGDLIHATITEVGGQELSNCCSAAPIGNGDYDTIDIGICPECLEHCHYEKPVHEVEFWFEDVRVPLKYVQYPGTDDEVWHYHDHYQTGFEYCDEEVADHIFGLCKLNDIC